MIYISFDKFSIKPNFEFKEVLDLVLFIFSSIYITLFWGFHRTAELYFTAFTLSCDHDVLLGVLDWGMLIFNYFFTGIIITLPLDIIMYVQ